MYDKIHYKLKKKKEKVKKQNKKETKLKKKWNKMNGMECKMTIRAKSQENQNNLQEGKASKQTKTCTYYANNARLKC